jgi:DNA-binding MarR family transcriptional regulator
VSERHDFGILVGLAFVAFVDEMHVELARAGYPDLGRSYGYVFRALDGERLTVSQLAARLGMTKQGAAKIVNEMRDRGYVERSADAADARVRRLDLSSRGRAALAAARRFHAGYEARLAARVGIRRAATVRSVLESCLSESDDPGAAVRTLRPV